MSLVVLFALRIAQRPPDAEHPYGHTRAEAIAGSNVALLVIVSALLVGWEAIQRINVPHDLPPVWTLWIAAGNVLIKETLWLRKSGLEYFADIHIEVDQNLTVAEGHLIGHRVKDHLLQLFPTLRDVLVHLEPFPHFHPPENKPSS